MHETLKEHKSNRLGDKLQAAWLKEEENAKKRNKTPYLGRVLLKVFGLEIIFYGIVTAVLEFGTK